MLSLTNLCGFASAADGPDVRPDPVSWPPLDNAGFVATALTPAVAITGIAVPILLRVAVSTPLDATRTLTVLRDGLPVAEATSGSALDVTFADGQVLQVGLANAADLTTWVGTLSLANLSDGATALAACSFRLQDTGSAGGGGGGGGSGGPSA